MNQISEIQISDPENPAGHEWHEWNDIFWMTWIALVYVTGVGVFQSTCWMKTRGMKHVDVTQRAGAFFAGGHILDCQAPLKKLVGGSISSALWRGCLTFPSSIQPTKMSPLILFLGTYGLGSISMNFQGVVHRCKDKGSCGYAFATWPHPSMALHYTKMTVEDVQEYLVSRCIPSF